MQVLIEVPDEKAPFVMELLKNLSFVEIKVDKHLSSSDSSAFQTQLSLSPKTASLLGIFPELAIDDLDRAREESIVRKYD